MDVEQILRKTGRTSRMIEEAFNWITEDNPAFREAAIVAHSLSDTVRMKDMLLQLLRDGGFNFQWRNGARSDITLISRQIDKNAVKLFNDRLIRFHTISDPGIDLRHGLTRPRPPHVETKMFVDHFAAYQHLAKSSPFTFGLFLDDLHSIVVDGEVFVRVVAEPEPEPDNPAETLRW